MTAFIRYHFLWAVFEWILPRSTRAADTRQSVSNGQSALPYRFPA